MIEFLKTVFKTKNIELEAKLQPTPDNTFGGKAEVEFESWSDGTGNIEAEIKHSGIPDGTEVEVVCGGNPIAKMAVLNGFAKAIHEFDDLNPTPNFSTGDRVQFLLEGIPIFQGQFIPD